MRHGKPLQKLSGRAPRSLLADVHANTKRRLVAALSMLGPAMVIVEEFRQLLPRAFVAFGFVTENNRALEQGFLQPLGQIAPKVERGCAENEEIALGAGRRA
jgi:hypothetical protein